MDPIKKIPKKFTKKSGNKVINRQYFCRKTGLQGNGYFWHLNPAFMNTSTVCMLK